MKPYFITLAGVMIVSLCGCAHTVIGGHGDSPDQRYRVQVTSEGAPAKAYSEKSRKEIWISIAARGDSAALFQQRYEFSGSAIAWDIRWHPDETVSVVLYDWGDGVSNYNNMMHLTSANHIATLSFAFDPTIGRFVERERDTRTRPMTLQDPGPG